MLKIADFRLYLTDFKAIFVTANSNFKNARDKINPYSQDFF